MSESTIAEHDRHERNANKCPNCGKHALTLKYWCVAGDDWQEDNCSLDGGTCPLYQEEICEGFKTYRYCRECGFKEIE